VLNFTVANRKDKNLHNYRVVCSTCVCMCVCVNRTEDVCEQSAGWGHVSEGEQRIA